MFDLTNEGMLIVSSTYVTYLLRVRLVLLTSMLFVIMLATWCYRSSERKGGMMAQLVSIRLYYKYSTHEVPCGSIS